MGNQICLTDHQTKHYAYGSPETKWSREDLKTGSFQTSPFLDQKENLLQLIKAGPALPSYKNELSSSKWNLALQESTNMSIITSDDKVAELYRKNNEFDQLVMLGPPCNLRWASWKLLLLDGREEISYERMLERKCRDESMICKDINRTLVSHKLFSDAQFGQDQLKRVLLAVSNCFPSMGYCQGMNFVAAMLLVVSGCDERYSYQCLLSLLSSEKHLLYFNFSENMPFHFFSVKLLHQLIRKKFPQFSQKLDGISDAFWLSKMVLSLFLYVFKLDDCVRCWDYIIARGAIRGIPELILGFIEVTMEQLMSYDVEDFGLNFQGADSSTLKFNIGELIFAAKQHHSITRQLIVKIARQQRNERYDPLVELLTKFGDRQSFQKQVNFCISQLINA